MPEDGLEEGIEKGIEKGKREEKIAMIHFLEGVLHRRRTPKKLLVGLSLVELSHRLEDLQKQITQST